MQLCLDIGNTRTKLGLFDAQNMLQKKAIWDNWTLKELQTFAQENSVKRVVLSNVAAPNQALIEFLENNFEYLELTTQTKLPFKNAYRTPETLGKDRLANVAGAKFLFPEKNCIIVDCGTCIKYDLLHRNGTFLGGNIAPGAAMRLKAMRHFTARLPEPQMMWPTSEVGSSTETALQNGALLGVVYEIQGFIRNFRQKLMPEAIAILTGGDADFFAQKLPKKGWKKEADLGLIGLNFIGLLGY